jgi:hypothetical protein
MLWIQFPQAIAFAQNEMNARNSPMPARIMIDACASSAFQGAQQAISRLVHE